VSSNGRLDRSTLAVVDDFEPLAGTHSSVANGSNLIAIQAVTGLALLSAAFEAKFGKPLIKREVYRPFEIQEQYKADQPRTGVVAATPGTSVHGWALAVDFASGVETYGSPEKAWTDANAPAYGFDPTGNLWEQRGLGNNEAWHFEWNGVPTIISGSTTAALSTEHLDNEEDDMALVTYHKVTTPSSDPRFGILSAGRFFAIEHGAEQGYIRAMITAEVNMLIEAGKTIEPVAGNVVWQLATSGKFKRVGW